MSEVAAKKNSMKEKRLRCSAANRVINQIASCGDRTFHYKGRIAELQVDDRGVIWFVDEYSQKRIYTRYKYRWRGFSHGGTMRGVIDALCGYIRTGEPFCNVFGPWPDWYSNGDPWGYGEDMELIRELAIGLGIYRRSIQETQDE